MTTSEPRGRLAAGLTVVYGLVVITAFGSWFYGFGVLIEPIASDTGWSEGWLSTAYGVGMFLVGIGSVLAGRTLDRFGPRPVFLLGAAGGGAGAAVTATATGPVVFAVAAVVTQAFVGAVGYYTLVHAAIARLAPEDRTRAITVNTLWGAFSSPLFLPLMAWLATDVGWRGAIAVGTGAAVATFLVAGVVSPTGVPGPRADEGRTMLGDLAHTLRDPVMRRLLAAGLLGGITFSVLILYQVPAMVSAGLALGTASTLAGVRGLFQLAGRLPLPWLVRRLGSRTCFRLALALMGISALVLPFSGSIAVAAVFAVIAGLAVGAYSPMESVYAAELAPQTAVGMVLGAYAMVRGVGAAVGPATAGLLTDLTDSRVPALVAVAVAGLLAALVVPPRPAPAEGDPESARSDRLEG